MSQDSNLGSSPGGHTAIPLLLECDLGGRVLRTSPGFRNILPNPAQFLDIISVKALQQPTYGLELPYLRFWKVWEFRDSVLVGAVGTERLPEAQDLASVHRNLTNNLFRLLVLERELSERARRRRGLSGKKAMRQMELERQRLGRELHTGAGQMLAAIRWHVEALRTELDAPAPTVQNAIESISTLAAQALEQVRDLSRRLHPPEWQRLTLASAIRQLWELSGIPERLQGTLHIDALVSEPDMEVKVLIYRAFQEALANLLRHAHATSVTVSLRLVDARLVLSVQDNGVGFDAEKLFSAPPSLASGIGLWSIREMAQGLGGGFRVESGPSGTTLVVSAALALAN